MAKYHWIFDVGLGLLYMWILSDDENSENGMSAKKRRGILFNLYKEKKLDSIINETMKRRYIRLLASQEKKTLDVLCFAELLYWVDDYVKKEILV